MYERTKKISFFRQYIILVVIILFIMLISFVATNYIVKHLIYNEQKAANEVIFTQLQEQLGQYEERINFIFRKVAYSENLVKIIESNDYNERRKYLDWYYELADDNRVIVEDVRNTALYNREGDLLVSKGNYFLSMDKIIVNDTKPTYSPVIISDNTNYFYVKLPVLRNKSDQIDDIVGHIVLIIGTIDLYTLAEKSLLNDDSGTAFFDREGNLLASAGVKVDKEIQSSEDYLVQRYISKQGDIELVNITPKRSLFKGTNLVRKISSGTYIIVLILITVICLLVYRTIIQPIKKQIKFMESYTDNFDKRIEVIGNNELSEMAEKMNQMLDDIDDLTKNIIYTQKAYLDLEYQKKITEMVALRNQINPHFLYNTFECIRGMALYKDQKEIAEVTQSLSRFFRYSVKGEEKLPIEEIFKSLRDYAKIIEYRFLSKYKISFKIEEGIGDYIIPKMLIQPILENAVFYAFENKTFGAIHVNARKKEKYIYITVEDDGQGITQESLKSIQESIDYYDSTQSFDMRTEGIGLMNVYRRIKLFYGEEGKFEIESNPSGTKVRLILPIDLDIKGEI